MKTLAFGCVTAAIFFIIIKLVQASKYKSTKKELETTKKEYEKNIEKISKVMKNEKTTKTFVAPISDAERLKRLNSLQNNKSK